MVLRQDIGYQIATFEQNFGNILFILHKLESIDIYWLNRFSPRFVEHLNLLRLDVKSRIHAGSVIYYF